MQIPKHIAVIMDGNGRWAHQRNLPRIAGHRAGLESAKSIIKNCSARGISVLSLFAFSSENWQRPKTETDFLMELFLLAIRKEIAKLHENNVQFHVLGDRSVFSDSLRAVIEKAEQLTEHNTGMVLLIAANYGGLWDIAQATQKMCAAALKNNTQIAQIQPVDIEKHLSTARWPNPDLFIRTSGEKRISNFFLWQLVYAELYFTDTLWPDFNAESLDNALADYAGRQRRYGGLTAENTSKT